MTRERYGIFGTVIAVLALVSLVASLLIPLPGRPEPGHVPGVIFQLQNWGRVVLFYGSGVLLVVACVFWRLASPSHLGPLFPR